MTLAFLDLETTGLDPATARIVEVAVTDDHGNALFHSLVNPGIPIPPEATAVHGIDWDKVASRPKFPEIASALRAALDGRVIAGYNVLSYDVPLLNTEFRRYDLPTYEGPVVDALLMWRALEPRTLTGAARHFLGVDHDGAHTALGDAAVTARIFRRLLAIHHLEETTPSDLATKFAPPSRIQKGRITFGKHQGKLLSEIPRDYRQWMLGQSFDAATLADIRASLV